MQNIKAKEPFRFYTRQNLTELAGVKATSLEELIDGIKLISSSSIYHHIHNFLQAHRFLSADFTNDFAYWVATSLGDEELGEKLAGINTIEFRKISDLRKFIVAMMEAYIREKPQAKLLRARRQDAFYFMKSISFIYGTDQVASDLEGFVDILKRITPDSIYFHIFEARLRLEKESNDFSNWIEHSLGEKSLAGLINRIDPYGYTLEDLRNTIVKVIENKP